MLNKEPTEALGLVVEGRAVDPEPPANSSPGTGQVGLDLRPDPAPPLRAQIFPQGDLQGLGLEHLVGQELLQLGVLPLKVSQPLHLLDAHAAVLASPAVEALGACVVLAADVLDPQASVRLGHADYLLGSASCRFHR